MTETIIRRVEQGDAEMIAALLTDLGYPNTPKQAEQRIVASLLMTLTAVFVAELGGKVVGLLSFHCIPLFHADGFLGRITSLVVSPGSRQRGIGGQLVAVAEEFAREQGCGRIEVTSGDHRPEAHAFYEKRGYATDCRRFIKHVS